MSAYIVSVSRHEEKFVAIPAFTSKEFRHSCIFVNRNSGIKVPADLRGRRVGLPEYHMTAAFWQRAIIQHEYGVMPKEIEWITGGLEQPGRKERIDLHLSPDIRISRSFDRGLDEMLVNGDIDALFGPYMPPSFLKPNSPVERLFPDYHSVEVEYYRKTGLFPIMHTVVIKKAIYDENPWIAQSLYKAFLRAKDACLSDMYDPNALTHSLPFLMHAVEETRELFGADIWSYGVDSNRAVLEAMVQYSYEQGLSARLVDVEELFPASTVSSFHV